MDTRGILTWGGLVLSILGFAASMYCLGYSRGIKKAMKILEEIQKRHSWE